MREKISVLYYPDFWVEYPTLAKAILFFDEIHLMDRPSMMFGAGPGQFGTIAAASPLRQYEASFRDNGVRLFVHGAPQGPVYGAWYEEIKRDVNDQEFLRRFVSGLKSSASFRRLQIAPGNYGQFGNQDDVAKKLIELDFPDCLGNQQPIELFEDPSVRHMDLSTPITCAKDLISRAVTCSAILNFALKAGVAKGFIPLADASPYGDLLGAKYARAIKATESASNKIQLSDLSFAIFDELLSTETVKKITLGDVIRYRKESQNAREEFLEHLSDIQQKQASIGLDGDYSGAIRKLIDAEIKPAVQTFRKRLEALDDVFYANIVKGALGAVSGSSVLTLFGDSSWQHLLLLASAAAGYVAKTGVDSILAERAARRECSISYVLSLDSLISN